MDWTLYLVCTLISMTSIGCEHNPRMYHQYDHTDNNDGPDDVATKRISERSIPFDSAQQRLQEGLAPHPSMSPDVVVFPGPDRQAATQFVPNVPEECQKTRICEDVPGYPEDHVDKLIEALGNATDKFQVDELDTPEIAQRLGAPHETELCEASYKVVVPQAAPDKGGKWHFIVNKKGKPLQGFKVELCKERKSPCSKVAHFYSGYEASCKQKYMLRTMAGLDAHGKMVDRDFQLPTCCSCVVKNSK